MHMLLAEQVEIPAKHIDAAAAFIAVEPIDIEFVERVHWMPPSGD